MKKNVLKYILLLIFLFQFINNNAANIVFAANKNISKVNPKVKSLILTSPNGGEIWQAGKDNVITWESSEIDYVDLSYSTNNGITWNNIITSYAATWQQYLWSIPETITPSQEFLIKVSETGNPALFDVSNNKLTLTKIIITSPGPALSFLVNRQDTIKWQASSDIDSVDISISFNNGDFTFIKRVKASLGKYVYLVPDNASTFNKIKISNYNKPQFYYTTDYFRIAKLVITSPIGGESWFNGTRHPITWQSNSISHVKIEYTTDGGATWNNITNNYSAALNFYNWNIPYVGTSQGKIKITDINEPSIYTISNGFFNLLKLFITTPNDSTGWKIGSNVNIDWSTNLTDNVKLEISYDDGNNWQVIANNISASLQTYPFTVPNNPTNKGIIRITSVSQPTYRSVSEGKFTIGNITITNPNGGIWQAGTQQDITWSSSGINLVKIEYTTNNGTNWNLIHPGYSAASGAYAWSIPSNLAANNVKIKISDAETNNNVLQDISSNFAISNIKILTPSNADVYQSGTNINITWVASSVISNVYLAYKTENDATWQPINNNNPVQASLGSYNWVVPNNLFGKNCQIKISASDNPDNYVINDGYFRIGYINLISPNGGEKLIGNGTYNIKWNSSNSIDFIKLEYSLDGGVSYITIPGSYGYSAASGLFTWQVPNVISANVKIRISDIYAPNTIQDVSNNTFSIAQLSLTYPNGGEGFYPGQPITITWDVTNITNVNLSYRIGNGNWNNIVQGLPAVPKQYNWVIPNSISGDFDIKISATEDTSLFDIGNGKSKIANLQVKYPSLAGEIFQVGKNLNITWSFTSNISNVNIEISTDNGVNWNFIATRPASDSIYSWIITNIPTTQGLIRISDAANSNIFDISDNTFTIKYLDLNYPNGGERFLADSTINILWNSTNVLNVKISYSLNNNNWVNIATVPALPASYNWKLPNIPSSNVKIKIEDADNLSLNISDVSNQPFLISTVKLIAPNGGESFTVGSNQLISWQTNSNIQKVRLELTTNGGSSWVIIKDSLNANLSSYNWVVPNYISNNCRIRIVDLNNPISNATMDESDASFAIGSILLTSPNGGERYQVGSKKNITWVNINSVSKINLYYSTNNGFNWNSIVTNYDATLESYEWTIPNVNVPGNGILVKITSYADSTIKDVSDNYFSIVNITVNYPNGNEVYKVGEKLPIGWSSWNIQTVNLQISYDNGTTWNNIATGINASAGFNNTYTIPDVISTQALVRIIDNNDATILDRSDNTFKVLKLDLISPDGGESYKIGTTKTITWNSGFVNLINIYQSIDNGVNWVPIVTNYNAALGSYNWVVSNNSTNNFKVKIVDTANPTVSDSSSNAFTVGNISVIEPILGEVLKANSIKTIKWNSTTGLNAVKLEFSSDNGATWELIENNVPASLGSYNWVVKDVATTSGLIRISHAVGVTDIIGSSGNFTINKLMLTYPNGGEYLQSGMSYNITWTSSIVGNVKIEYSLDNGITWNNIISSIAANLGSYNWVVPTNLSSTQAIIKVTDLNNPLVKDSSDAPFKIGDVNITNIVGGEYLQTGTIKTINFITTNSINRVNIEYTLDGITWLPIANDILASLGSVNWNIGDIAASSTAKIRISDAQSSLAIKKVTNNFNVVRLNLIYPNGGELLQAGKNININWEGSTQIPFVNIYYSTDNGISWSVIANNVASAGNTSNMYNWSIPSNVASENSLIRIEATVNNNIKTISLNKFTISRLEITTPTITTKWQTDRTNKIEWNSQFLGSVKIDFSTNNGTTWSNLISNYNSAISYYNWTVPLNSYSNQVRVRITSETNSAISEISAPFTLKRLDLKVPNGGELWKSGTTKTITWDANYVNTVSLYLSSNNGQTWDSNPIVSAIAGNLGQYNWAIPSNYTGTNYKIKIKDDEVSTISDSSNARFTINSFALTSPLGGELWQQGKSYLITWNYSNVNLVKLEYSIDNGTTWNTIITNLNAALQQYSWQVPNVVSTQARIKITDVQDNNNYYVSNPFTICQLTLVSPNGGEVWLSGTIKPITWSSVNNNNVNLYYSTDNGNNWVTIAENINASLGSYNWQLPNNLFGSVRLKISNYDNSSVFDLSDNTITIKYLNVVYPNGGEVFQAGKTVKISYNYSPNITLVNIFYSSNNGVNWTNINNGSTVANGEYIYTFPITSTNTNLGLFRVEDANAATVIYDQSDANFTVSSLLLTYPNGNEHLQIGKSYNITWSAGTAVNKVSLDYYTETKGWKLIVDNINANLGTYSWVIPNDPSNNVKVRVRDYENSSIADVSDTTLRVANVNLLTPNSNLRWQVGSIKEIQYNKTNNVKYVNLEYSINGGTTYKPPIAMLDSSVNNIVKWRIPDDTTLTAKVKVTDASSGGAIFDESDVNFVITKLEINNPNGNTSLLAGSTQQIKWISTRDIDSVNIKLSLDNGNSWSILSKEKANKYLYNWVIPNNANTENAYILIEDTKDISIKDTSNKLKIIPANLTLTYPVGGEVLQQERNYNITWTRSNSVQLVNIEISTNNGTNWSTIVSNYPADSLKYSYNVPNGFFTDNAKIRITDALNSFVKSESNIFKIVGLKLTSFNQPNLHFMVGETKQITWSATNNLSQINIEYNTNNGSWKPIALNVNASAGSYTWIIPNDPSNELRIRLTFIQSSAVNDISQIPFRVANISVVSPNTFTKVQTNRYQTIKWNFSNNITSVNLYYSTNNGAIWLPIGSKGITAAGEFNWLVPDNVSTNALIKVEDNSAPTFIYDTSDTIFVISKLEVTKPDNGSLWASGDTKEIKWESSNDIDSVNIYVSLDDGVLFNKIAEVKANLKTYNWSIPNNINSDKVRILINDSKYTNIKDTSDKFTIYSPQLSIVAPNGGEYVNGGKYYEIKWQKSNEVRNIKIEYRNSPTSSWQTIVASYPADSLKYNWLVTQNATDSAQIKISDVLSPFVYDVSDNVFKIAYITVLAPNGGEHVQSGKTMLIKWNGSSNINNVKIEYSLNGINYVTIASGIANSLGSYLWNIPNIYSANAYIRVSDEASVNLISDINDNPFIISLLQLTTPSSNTQIQAGKNYSIKWISSPEIENVNIDYSIDGITWNRITTISANLGEYNWLVPNNLCSSTGKLRIWDNTSINIIDTSKYQITFKQLDVVIPMGNENWQVGTTQELRWSSCLIDTVHIEYSINNGLNWIRIADNVSASSGKYNWIIPNTPTQNALIRLIDKSNPAIVALSNKFVIFNPSLKLLVPNGGEIWQAGSSKTIRWQSTNVNYVKIEFSADSGKTWTLLRNSISADSFFVWNPIPPNLETKGAMIKITDVLNSHIKDSSLVFTITQLKLLAPLGGEYWQSGTIQKIKWHAGLGINTINLEYTLNNGQTWETIQGAQNYLASADSFAWSIPTTGSNAVKVRIRETYDATINSASPDTFTIGWVNVIYPNGNEVVQAGMPVNIKWQNSDNIKNVKVEIYNYTNNQVIAFTEVAANLKEINLLTPSNFSSDSLKIRLSASNSNYSIVDYSDNYFRCMMLNLLTPVVGSSWRALTERNITWEASSNNNTVRLEFSSDSGVSWSNIVTNILASQKSYSWLVPNNVSATCLVRIVNEEYTNVKDSSGIFTIFIPELTLNSPNGNEYYQVNKTYKIKWNYSFITTVKIEFSSDNGNSWEVIKQQVPANLKEWNWTITNKNWATIKGLIRISDYSDANIYDISNANFTIGWIDVISPDGGENWLSNTKKLIKWNNSNSVYFVNIYYNNGIDTNWVQLAVNFPADSGKFTWQQIPNVETNRGKIKITDALSNGEISDLSNNYFLITKLYVIEPNGGEVYYRGNTYQIKWTPSININALKILLSTDGGKNYNVVINNSYPSQSGYYNWVVPENYYSDSAKIKLVNAEDTTISATSVGYFTLGNLQLLVFNSPEKVLENSVKKIVWESSPNIKKVDLYYWTKNKIKIPIAIDQDATKKFYNWVIPESVSDSCYIAIYDHHNYRFYDTCNAPFTISRLKLLYPRGDEVWKIGEAKEFVWESAYINKVNIEFITDDSTGTAVFPASSYKFNDLPINASLGRFSKVIDRNIAGLIPSKHVRIRIIETNTTEKLTDTCNSTLTISEIKLVYPNGGENFGKADSIKWECSTNTIEKVNLYYKRDDMVNWRLIASNVPANSSSYKWVIKNIDPAMDYRIKIEDANIDPKYKVINDVSDDKFTISDLNLIYPNGGEKLKAGKTYAIKWNSIYINLVKLEYTTDDGQSWNLISNDPISAIQKSYDWTIPFEFSRKVKIRVSDYDKSIINDVSDTTFTIADITLLAPNNLMALNVGTNYEIKWSQENVDTVRIQLSTDNGKNWNYNLATLSANLGVYNWQIPSILTTQARIRIIDKTEANISDTSNSHFVIGKYPTVKVISGKSNIIKFFFEFLTPQESITIDRFEYQLGDGPIINNTESLINPPYVITGPANDTLYWRSTDKLNNLEGSVKVYIKFRSPQFNVYYDIFIDSVAFDNKAPVFNKDSVYYYQIPKKLGWSKVVVKWEKATDLSKNITYSLNIYDLNNEYLNYTKITKGDSVTIPDITTSILYKVKIDVYDDYKNTNNINLNDFKALALGDFPPYDGVLDARDLANFVTMWSSKDSIKAVDFAPYDGNFPFIKVKGDNKLDLNDLLTFVNNWNFSQDYTLPKKGATHKFSSDITSERINFRTGNQNINFPLYFNEKDVLAITAYINYPTESMKFDSIKVKGLSENGLAFVKTDSLNGMAKIDFAELAGGLRNQYSITSKLISMFDKISKKDSLIIRYVGYKAGGLLAFDKTINYTLTEIPASYKLYQNYPNPFNPSTTIEYDLPEKTKVNLTVYDILGREVTTLVNEEQQEGTYRIIFDAAKVKNGLASGVYFIRMSTNNFKVTKKMLLLK